MTTTDIYRGSEGWVCPICKQGISPFVDKCPCRSHRDPLYPGITEADGPYVTDPNSEPVIQVFHVRGPQ